MRRGRYPERSDACNAKRSFSDLKYIVDKYLFSFHSFFPHSAVIPATVGAARIFSYHLMPRLGFELMSVELHCDPGPALPTELTHRGLLQILCLLKHLNTSGHSDPLSFASIQCVFLGELKPRSYGQIAQISHCS